MQKDFFNGFKTRLLRSWQLWESSVFIEPVYICANLAAQSEMKSVALKTFIIYSSKDKAFREELEQHLSLLTETGILDVWSDKQILPGEEWDKSIEKQLNAAKLVLMLISVDFFSSEYIRHKEFKKAIARRTSGDATVIPIIVRDCSWEIHPVVSELQVLPKGGKPVNSRHWPDRDEAWSDVVRNLALFIKKLAADSLTVPVKPTPKTEPPRSAHPSVSSPDTSAWKIAERLDNKSAYMIFLEEHSDSEFAAEAQKRLNSLKSTNDQKSEQQAIDDAAWKIASRMNSLAAYKIYLENHPDGKYAKEARQSIETRNPKLINGAVIRDGDGLAEMVFVEGGIFKMGSDKNLTEEPIHDVTVPDFFIGKYPVTVSEFKQFIDTTGYQTEADKMGSSGIWLGSEYKQQKDVNWKCDVKGAVRPIMDYNHPVIHISWNDAVAYCEWLSTLTGRQYRLPAEAEWEFAARGGNLSKGFEYSGSNTLDEVGWHEGNSGGRTHRVGEKGKPNELGLHDMSGNVYEWCEDHWHDNYESAPTDGSAWGGKYDLAVLRGDDKDSRIASRNWLFRDNRNGFIGFRLARDSSEGRQ